MINCLRVAGMAFIIYIFIKHEKAVLLNIKYFHHFVEINNRIWIAEIVLKKCIVTV